jgi:hypothetical protein
MIDVDLVFSFRFVEALAHNRDRWGHSMGRGGGQSGEG